MSELHGAHVHVLEDGSVIEHRHEGEKIDGQSHEHSHEYEHSHGHEHSHEYEHSHGHEHSHEHEYGHSHGQNHEHSHEHEYGHSHGHEHEHGHEHGYEHSHEHEHGYEHSHEHEHEYSHEHEHGHSHEHGHTHSHAHTKAVLNRLSRAIGHLESIKRMVENGRDCTEVMIQLSAVKSAINNTGKIILQDHIEHCIVDAVEHGDKEAIKELEIAIDRFVK